MAIKQGVEQKRQNALSMVDLWNRPAMTLRDTRYHTDEHLPPHTHICKSSNTDVQKKELALQVSIIQTSGKRQLLFSY